MKQPPFPFVLVGLTGFFAWLAVTFEGQWVPPAAAFAALLTGAAAVYQSWPAREPQDEEPDEWEPGT
jgi:hypothetical protein